LQCGGCLALYRSSWKIKSGCPAAIMVWSTSLPSVPRWQVRHFSERSATFEMLYIPNLTESSVLASFRICDSSQPEAGPWQLSQLTPSLMSKSRSLWLGEVASAWQARHFPEAAGEVFNPRIFPI